MAYTLLPFANLEEKTSPNIMEFMYLGGMFSVIEITTPKQMEQAFEIRRKVFVLEQKVDPNEEYDEYEKECIHLLALNGALPIGTCRIRKTNSGYKLERFAVLKEFRGIGAGAALVNACLNHSWLQPTETYIYMHAQEHAVDFYRKFGFEPKGELFWECEIPHYTMWKCN